MQDIGMTAKILQLVNSAFFGFRGPISTVEQAVSFLGLDTIQSMVLTCHVFSQFTVKDVATFKIDQLWQNSIKTGMLAREIAKSEGCTPLGIEQAYTAGLLHYAGILALLANLPDQFKSILARASANETPIFEVERSEIGITHAELGAYILGLWGLSDEIVEAVAYHHRPGVSLGKTFAPLTAVHVADGLLPCPIKQSAEERASEIDADYLERLQLSHRVPVWKELAEKPQQEATL
jgi:HD-like signal output (HDOD) protein